MQEQSVKIVEFPDPHFGQNSRIVHVQGSSGCWFLDPGFPPSPAHMLKYVSDNGLTPEAVVLTHAHADHIAGVPDVLQAYPELPVYLAKEEWDFLGDPSQNLSVMTGLDLQVRAAKVLDLTHGATLELASTRWEIRDTSGHSPGGRTLHCPEQGIAIVGDALFAGSIGRMDFPHSDGQRLLANIREQLLTLPGDTRVLSGHGPETTIEVERSTNPFVGSNVQL